MLAMYRVIIGAGRVPASIARPCLARTDTHNDPLMDIPETEMRSQLSNKSPRQARRAWEAPAITELSIGTETKAAVAGQFPAQPPNLPPAAPATKLGFAFEMSFPLSVRTE